MVNRITEPSQSAEQGDTIFDRVKMLYGIKSDTELAEALAVPRSTVASWKQRGSLPIEWLTKIATDKAVLVDWLLFGDRTLNPESPPLDVELMVESICLALVTGPTLEHDYGIARRSTAYYEDFTDAILGRGVFRNDKRSREGMIDWIRDQIALQKRIQSRTQEVHEQPPSAPSMS